MYICTVDYAVNPLFLQPLWKMRFMMKYVIVTNSSALSKSKDCITVEQ